MSNYRFPKKTIQDVPIHGTRVLMRADFNVPLKDGAITSDYRITQTVPTIEYLIKRGCEVILLAHLGRPKGEVKTEFTLEPIAKRLEELLGQPVNFVSDCVGDIAKQSLKRRVPKRVTLLENVRFHTGEESNDPEFAKQLINAAQPDYVVQDGFGVVHRAHASTEGISHLKPAVAGLLLEKEVSTLSAAIESPERPLAAVLGGAKISDKLPLVQRFVKTADSILIGGAMANNFIAQAGHKVGESLIDSDGTSSVGNIVDAAHEGQLHLPQDVVVASEVGEGADPRDCELDDVKQHERILDVGSNTSSEYADVIAQAKTVIWNGTMGMSEIPQFAKASAAVAHAMSELKEATTIIGGGDTADFVLDWLKDNNGAHFTHISTGGGASLELMSGLSLPGVEALLSK